MNELVPDHPLASDALDIHPKRSSSFAIWALEAWHSPHSKKLGDGHKG